MAEVHSDIDMERGGLLRRARERQGLPVATVAARVASAAKAGLLTRTYDIEEIEAYEKGEDCLSAEVLRDLAAAYGLGVVNLYLAAGILTPEDIEHLRPPRNPATGARETREYLTTAEALAYLGLGRARLGELRRAGVFVEGTHYSRPKGMTLRWRRAELEKVLRGEGDATSRAGDVPIRRAPQDLAPSVPRRSRLSPHLFRNGS